MFNLFNKKKEKKEKYSGRCFIFCYESSVNKIMDVICNIFGLQSNEKENTLALKNEDINISLLAVTSTMEEESKELLKNQINGVYSHFYEVETEKEDIKTNLLYKIRTAHGLVIINYDFDNEDVDEKKAMIENIFMQSLRALNAVILIRNDDYDGVYQINNKNEKELILGDNGQSMIRNYLPYESFMMRADGDEIKEDQIDRRYRTRAILEGRGIYVPAWYPLIESEEECRCRSKEETAKRAIALLIVALYSECLVGENMSVEEAYKFVEDIIKRFDAEDFFSQKEKEYLHNPDSTDQERIHYSWQYENLLIMEYALGLVERLDFPKHICDVPLTVSLLKDYNNFEEFLADVDMRSDNELLDECDLIFCYNWSCVDTRIHNLKAPLNMDRGVVVERHKSLNWLVGYDQRADWDDVGTDT